MAENRRIEPRELSAADLAALQIGTALAPMLAELAEWMTEHGEKGEQEGYL